VEARREITPLERERRPRRDRGEGGGTGLPAGKIDMRTSSTQNLLHDGGGRSVGWERRRDQIKLMEIARKKRERRPRGHGNLQSRIYALMRRRISRARGGGQKKGRQRMEAPECPERKRAT